MKELKTISVDRQALYEEIWENSLHKTAVKHNTTDSRLKEACITAQIPLPTKSYWSKKHMEMDVSKDIIPLPPSNISTVEIVMKTDRKATNAKPKKIQQKEVTKEHQKPQKKKKDNNNENAQSDRGVIRISRQELYDIIWKLKSMSEVAKQYNIPVTRLTAICEASNIPLPTPSHMGDRYNRWYMESVPLPESEQTEVKLFTRRATYKGAQSECQEYIQQIADLNHITIEKPQITARQLLINVMDDVSEEQKTKDDLLVSLLETPTLCSMDEDMREKVFRKAISMPRKTSGKLHPSVIRYKQSVEAWENATSYDARKKIPASIKNIAKSSRKRMYSIMTILADVMSAFDGELEDGAFLAIGKDRIGIEFVEGIDKIPHVLTKEEAKMMAKYEAEKGVKRFATKPNIQKYDHAYNGLLRIRIGNTYSSEGNRISIGDIRDGVTLEERMDEVLIAVFEKMELCRIQREIQEEKARKEAEEKRLAEERKQRISDEKDKTRELIACARRHKIAMEIREYVRAMRDAESAEYNSEWAEWALKKADWYDPVVAREDELLGKTVDLKKEQKPRTFWNGFY